MENVVVIGAGINGLWTTYNLCKEGVKPLLLEQFCLPHTRGSSHGQSRIIRYAYEKPHHAAMMPESFKCWRQLEETSGKNLLEKSGLITIYGEPCAGSNAVIKNLNSVGAPYKLLNADEISTEFPGLSVSRTSVGIYESEGGILKADKCLRTLQEQIVVAGGRILDECVVNDIIPVNEKRVIIKTSKKDIISKSVIITCGPWAEKVMAKIEIHLPLTPTRVQVYYWRNKEKSNLYSIQSGFPAVIIMDDTHVYSIPTMEYDGLMKVCFHDGIKCDPDFRDRFDDKNKIIFEKQNDQITNKVKKNFVNLEANPSVIESCIYTTTPDHDYIIDRHPCFNNIIFAAGFSGSGFKTSPVIGKFLTNMILNKENPSYVKKMKMNRFTNSKL